MLALGEAPQHETAWVRGAVGEEHVGAFLEKHLDPGTVLLNDRSIPRSRANIDHIAIAPAGVWVVDSKRYKGKVAVSNPLLVGGWDVPQRERLARWLGQRYSRPAIPDEDYEQITSPVRDAWKKLVEDEPGIAAQYNRTFSEWRYRREEDGSLTLYVLSPEREPDAVLALEVGAS